MASRPPINVRNHLASLRAMKEVLDRQRVSILTKTYGGRWGMTARVEVAGRQYDVSEAELARLQSGWTPDELELYPIQEE